MNKVNNIEYTFQIIRDFPLPVTYQQVEKWVTDYDEKKMKTEKPMSLKFWLSIKYKFLNIRKK